MHTSRLDEIENETGIPRENSFMTFSEDFDKIFLSCLKLLIENNFKKEVRLRDTFWFEDNPFHVAKTLQETIIKLSNAREGTSDNSLKFSLACLVLDLIALFNLSILRICGKLYSLPEHQRERYFMESLIAGKLSIAEKKELLDNFYAMMITYAKASREPLAIRREDLNFIPPYATNMYDLMTRFIRKIYAAKETPRLMEIYLSAYVFEKTIDFKDFQTLLHISKEEFDLALKFSRDIVDFLFDKEKPDFCVPLFQKNN